MLKITRLSFFFRCLIAPFVFVPSSSQADTCSLMKNLGLAFLIGLEMHNCTPVPTTMGNEAPELIGNLVDQTAKVDVSFDYSIPVEEVFRDPDGDSLTMTAKEVGESDLPGWLIFDSNTFLGTPNENNVGSYSIRVTATDSSDNSISDIFLISVIEEEESSNDSFSTELLWEILSGLGGGAVCVGTSIFAFYKKKMQDNLGNLFESLSEDTDLKARENSSYDCVRGILQQKGMEQDFDKIMLSTCSNCACLLGMSYSKMQEILNEKCPPAKKNIDIMIVLQKKYERNILIGHTEKEEKESLKEAVENGRLAVVRELFMQASHEEKDEALEYAAEYGHLGVVKELLPYASRHGKNEALGKAAFFGRLEVVKHLHPHASQDGKDYALESAAEYGHLGVVKELLPHASQKSKDQSLKLADFFRHLEVVKLLDLTPHVGPAEFYDPTKFFV